MTPSLALWQRVTEPALDEASLALAQMSGLDWRITSRLSRIVSPDTLQHSLQTLSNTLGYAVGLIATGWMTASLVLVFDDVATETLVSAMMGESVHVPLDVMGESALAEVGNVVGTAFLNVFANQFHTTWEPSPPVLTRNHLADLIRHQNADAQIFVTEGIFRVAGTQVKGCLLIIPHA